MGISLETPKKWVEFSLDVARSQILLPVFARARDRLFRTGKDVAREN
jgi:hypothetical protein